MQKGCELFAGVLEPEYYPTKADPEMRKYDEIYRTPRFRTYGHTNHGQWAIPWIKRCGHKKIIDVGCGYNEFIRQWRGASPENEGVGVDFACPGADVHGTATDLSGFQPAAFDLYTAFDVWEHLPEHTLEYAFNEMQRLAPYFCVSLGHLPCPKNLKSGPVGLHLTVKPLEWWIERIKAFTDSPVEEVDNTKAPHFPVRGRYLVGRTHNPLKWKEPPSWDDPGRDATVQESG